MKQIILLTVLSFFMGRASLLAQNSPVSWKAEIEKVSDSEYLLHLTAETEKNWVIYSQFLGEDGPIPTTFTVDNDDNLVLVEGFVEPDNGIHEMDEMFGMELVKFKGPATFTQKIQSTEALNEVKGTITYMTCDATKCLPPVTIDYLAKLSVQ